MPHLILIRHAQSQPDSNAPAHTWVLTEAGRANCLTLAEHLRPWQPDIMVASTEKKAICTGQLAAGALDIPFETAANLHEHCRSTVPFFASHADFQAAVAHFFAHPDELVLGEETANQAQTRFAQSVDGVVARHPKTNVAIATHGTVMSLYIAHATGWQPFPIWQRLGMPAFVVLSLPERKLISITYRLNGQPPDA